MKLESAAFHLNDQKLGDVVVTFAGDEVTVIHSGKSVTLENKPAKWGGRPYKPRVTDCGYAIKHAMGKPADTPAEERKRKKSRPNLRLARS